MLKTIYYKCVEREGIVIGKPEYLSIPDNAKSIVTEGFNWPTSGELLNICEERVVEAKIALGDFYALNDERNSDTRKMVWYMHQDRLNKKLVARLAEKGLENKLTPNEQLQKEYQKELEAFNDGIGPEPLRYTFERKHIEGDIDKNFLDQDARGVINRIASYGHAVRSLKDVTALASLKSKYTDMYIERLIRFISMPWITRPPLYFIMNQKKDKVACRQRCPFTGLLAVGGRTAYDKYWKDFMLARQVKSCEVDATYEKAEFGTMAWRKNISTGKLKQSKRSKALTPAEKQFNYRKQLKKNIAAGVRELKVRESTVKKVRTGQALKDFKEKEAERKRLARKRQAATKEQSHAPEP